LTCQLSARHKMVSHISVSSSTHSSPSDYGYESVSYCDTHGLEVGPGGCPIGQIEDATEEAIEKIKQVLKEGGIN